LVYIFQYYDNDGDQCDHDSDSDTEDDYLQYLHGEYDFDSDTDDGPRYVYPRFNEVNEGIEDGYYDPDDWE